MGKILNLNEKRKRGGIIFKRKIRMGNRKIAMVKKERFK